MQSEIRNLKSEIRNSVDQLLADLKSADWQVRWRAAEALAERGDGRALEALATVHRDPYWEVRHAAVRAWAAAKDSQRQPVLLEALADPMYWIGQVAVEGLVRIGPAVVEPLIEALGDARPEVPSRAATALGQLGEGPLAQAVVGTLTGEAEQREQLLRLGDARAIPPLLKALANGRSDVQVHAAAALGQLGDRRATEPLIGALRDGGAELRQAAAAALGQLGDRRAAEPLLEALRDGNAELQRAAAAALGQLGDPDAQPALRALANDRRRPEAVRAAAREALAKIEAAWSGVSRGALAVAEERAIGEGAIAVAEGDHEGAKAREETQREMEGADPGSGWKRRREPWWRRLKRG